MLAALPEFISSRDNPLLKALRRLARDSNAYRKQGRVWVEGDHLCGAALVARNPTGCCSFFSFVLAA